MKIINVLCVFFNILYKKILNYLFNDFNAIFHGFGIQNHKCG
jgi:hypothetical protein